MPWQSKAEWSADWQRVLNWGQGDFSAYRLQLANCRRIENNPAVYIFDEVGAGKTVCSGLMAVHYLYNNPSQRVLVITTHALAQDDPDQNSGSSQNKRKNRPLFLNDWYDLLHIDALGLADRITVVSNNYANINSREPEKGKSGPASDYGLIIIDEAQEFLEQKNERYKNLIANSNGSQYTLTDRVVFLSATPIKQNGSDLKVYCKIAAALLRRPDPYPYNTPINSNDQANYDTFFRQILGEEFDPDFPATRYFKSTVMSLKEKDSGDNFEYVQGPKRQFSCWEWDDTGDKDTLLLDRIYCVLHPETLTEQQRKEEELGPDEGPRSRFVIFVRLVKDEAKSLGKRFQDDPRFTGEKIRVVTGENSSELERYTTLDSDLPRVLILNYQIAEAGVNLPGYNFVINYHIPPYPSSLEQRFGRIDRIPKGGQGLLYDTIHVRYLLYGPLLNEIQEESSCPLSPNQFWKNWETNTFNFCRAIDTCLNGLLPYLPSRNALLDVQLFRKYRKLVKRYKHQLKDIGTLPDEYFAAFQQAFGGDSNSPVPQKFQAFIDFCRSQEYDSTKILKDKNPKKALEDEIKRSLESLSKQTEHLAFSLPMSDSEYEDILNNPDDIFYRKDPTGPICRISVQECTEQIWRSFQKYQKQEQIGSGGLFSPKGLALAHKKAGQAALAKVDASSREQSTVAQYRDCLTQDYKRYLSDYKKNLVEQLSTATKHLLKSHPKDKGKTSTSAEASVWGKWSCYCGFVEKLPKELPALRELNVDQYAVDRRYIADRCFYAAAAPGYNNALNHVLDEMLTSRQDVLGDMDISVKSLKKTILKEARWLEQKDVEDDLCRQYQEDPEYSKLRLYFECIFKWFNFGSTPKWSEYYTQVLREQFQPILTTTMTWRYSAPYVSDALGGAEMALQRLITPQPVDLLRIYSRALTQAFRATVADARKSLREQCSGSQLSAVEDALIQAYVEEVHNELTCS